MPGQAFCRMATHVPSLSETGCCAHSSSGPGALGSILGALGDVQVGSGVWACPHPPTCSVASSQSALTSCLRGGPPGPASWKGQQELLHPFVHVILFWVKLRGSWVHRLSDASSGDQCASGPAPGPARSLVSALARGSWEPSSSEPEAEVCVKVGQQLKSPAYPSRCGNSSSHPEMESVGKASKSQVSLVSGYTGGHSQSPTRGGLVLQSDSLSRYVEC